MFDLYFDSVSTTIFCMNHAIIVWSSSYIVMYCSNKNSKKTKLKTPWFAGFFILPPSYLIVQCNNKVTAQGGYKEDKENKFTVRGPFNLWKSMEYTKLIWNHSGVWIEYWLSGSTSQSLLLYCVCCLALLKFQRLNFCICMKWNKWIIS